jgi:hypothetical protein
MSVQTSDSRKETGYGEMVKAYPALPNENDPTEKSGLFKIDSGSKLGTRHSDRNNDEVCRKCVEIFEHSSISNHR